MLVRFWPQSDARICNLIVSVLTKNFPAPLVLTVTRKEERNSFFFRFFLSFSGFVEPYVVLLTRFVREVTVLYLDPPFDITCPPPSRSFPLSPLPGFGE